MPQFASTLRVIAVHRGLDSGGYRHVPPQAGRLDLSVKLHQGSLMTTNYPVSEWAPTPLSAMTKPGQDQYRCAFRRLPRHWTLVMNVRDVATVAGSC
jgi:hypothetical protein